MKKSTLIIFIFLLIALNSFAQTSFPRINFFGEASVENNLHLIYLNNDTKFKTNTGFNIGAEVIILNHQSPVKYGLGIIYQLPQNVVNEDGDYSFIPFFAFTRIDLIKTDFITPTIQLKLGYNILIGANDFLGAETDLKGGLYYSIGSILNMSNKIQIRLFYSVNYGESSSDTDDYLIRNDQFSIGVGYGF